MGDPNEAPRFSDKLSRRAFNAKFAAPFLAAAVGLVSVAASCDRTDSDVPPGKKLLDEGSQRLAEKAREAAGMGSPTAAPLQAKEMTPRTTMAAPDYPATVEAQKTEIARLQAAAKTPEPAKPAEKPKPVEEVKITLKPQELYRALLATPFRNDELPEGFTTKGNYAAEPDQEARVFGAIGQAEINLNDSDPKYRTAVSIIYVVFPDLSSAKGAYNVITTRSNTRILTDFGYSANMLRLSDGGDFSICSVLIDNVLIRTQLYSPEARVISLAKAGIKHLQRVGNPGR